ncbi:MAG: hypothetical protein SV062_09815 [Thermodesulfobacteriota bacterium]|nr:hypothetical protein [Thermodesulfobacteriota bacterium]
MEKGVTGDDLYKQIIKDLHLFHIKVKKNKVYAGATWEIVNEFVKDSLYYTPNPPEKYSEKPEVFLSKGRGDCYTFARIYWKLLKYMGHKSQLIYIHFYKNERFAHMICVFKNRKKLYNYFDIGDIRILNAKSLKEVVFDLEKRLGIKVDYYAGVELNSAYEYGFRLTWKKDYDSSPGYYFIE